MTTCFHRLEFGTTVIAVLREREVFVGADSQQQDIHGRPNGFRCKIAIENGEVAAFAGAQGMEGSWHILGLARAALGQNGTVTQRLNVLVEAIGTRLLPPLAHMRIHAPEMFAQREGRVIVEGVLVLRDAHGTFLNFKMAPFSEGSHGVRLDLIHNEANVNSNSGWVSLGYTDAVQQAVGPDEHYWDGVEDIPARIRELIQLQAAATPNGVGGDISVAKWTAGKTEWVYAGACS